MVIGISVLITACGYDSHVKCTAVAWFISLICSICDWPLAELRNGALRLAAGGHSVSSGFLEMYYDSQWGSICSEGWDSVDTSVACSQLGFPDTNFVAFNVSARNTAASQPVHSSNVQCDGTESSIFDQIPIILEWMMGICAMYSLHHTYNYIIPVCVPWFEGTHNIPYSLECACAAADWL